MKLFLGRTSKVLIINRVGCLKSEVIGRTIKDELSSVCDVRFNDLALLKEKIDLLVCIGGDGTLLRCSSLLTGGDGGGIVSGGDSDNKSNENNSNNNNNSKNNNNNKIISDSTTPTPIPPILPISTGSLGFMLPNTTQEALDLIRASIKREVNLPIMWRRRLLINGKYTALNDVTIAKRDDLISVTADIFERNHQHQQQQQYQQNEQHQHQHISQSSLFTGMLMDGLLVCTPTGSTAHSLTSGGHLLHPSVGGKILMPLAPQSLSMRPLILPLQDGLRVIIRNRRYDHKGIFCDLLIDGKKTVEYSSDNNRDFSNVIEITESPHPLPIIDIKGDWIASIKDILGWASPFIKR